MAQNWEFATVLPDSRKDYSAIAESMARMYLRQFRDMEEVGTVPLSPIVVTVDTGRGVMSFKTTVKDFKKLKIKLRG